MAEIKKYLDTAALGTLVDQIKSEDAKGLQSAKNYADSLAKNYDASCSAASALADAKAYTDELAKGQVATNKADIAKLNGDATTEGSVAKAVADAKALVDADVDAVEAKADKNAEDIAAINNAENGILAQAKADATEKANAVQEAVDVLAGKVGEVPADQTVMGIIANIQENAYDDTEIRGLITGLTNNKADKTQVATDIENAVKAETEARESAIEGVQGAVDTLSGTHATDKKALEDAIALKADKTALDEVSGVANAAVKQADYDVKVKALEDEDARIEGLVTAEVERATKAEKANADAIKAVADDYLKAADKTELQGNIDVVAGKVTTLVGDDANKSVRTIANEELAKQLVAEGAAESLDTLAEIAAWIQSHPEDAAAMNKAIDDLEALVGTLPEGITATTVVGYIAEVQTAIQAEIDRLNAEKQDVITEKVLVSGGEASEVTYNTDNAIDNIYEYTKVSNEVLDVNNIVSDIKITYDIYEYNEDSGSWDYKYDWTYDAPVANVKHATGYSYIEETDSPEYALVLIVNEDNVEIHSGQGTFDKGVYFYTPWNDAYSVTEMTFTYKSSVEGMVVKKEHLPSDVVYQDALDNAIGNLNTSNEGLSAEIAKKADKTTVEGIDGRLTIAEDKVSALEGKMTTVEGAVATKVEQEAYNTKIAALEGADAGQVERIAALEAKFGEGEGSVEDQIADAKQEAIDAAALDATTKANKSLEDAKKYADAEVAKDRARLDSLEAIEHHEHSNKAVLDGITAEKVTGWDNAAAKAHEHSNKTVLDGITSENVTTWNTVTSKASQTDLDNAVARIAVNEGAINTLNDTVADKAEQDDLDAAVLRIAANESAIAANTSAINSFTPITSEEVNALFA